MPSSGYHPREGKLVAAKRADRSATEGVVVSKIVGGKGYMLCLACETDFVAKNSEFSATANEILEIAVKADAADLEALKAVSVEAGRTVADKVTEKSGQTARRSNWYTMPRSSADVRDLHSYEP